MVARRNIIKNTHKRYALISTFAKEGLTEICSIFKQYNIGIISTGSTAKEIIALGFKCHNVSDVTNFKEILDGRVKTLHPKIHASLLFDRKIKTHVKSFANLKFPKIDFLVVNLYPFKKTILNKKKFQEKIEMIDIGGNALLRSGAKNFNFVTTVCSISDYKLFINEIKKHKGKTSLNFRKKMAAKVFNVTSNYDQIISKWFQGINDLENQIDKFEKIKLRYGENPNQKGFVLLKNSKKSLTNKKIHGKEMSYNNILDIDSALNCLSEFTEPTCVIVKHNNPCGVASDKNINSAANRAFESDEISSFGGIVAINRRANIKFANKFSKKFIEVIIANGFNKNALKVLKNKKNLILINSKNFQISKSNELKSINDGYLMQSKSINKIKMTQLIQTSNFKTTPSYKNDLLFALKVCKHVKSNAIVLCKNKKTLGIGAGQMNRRDSCKIALMKVNKKTKQSGFIAASDAFFPFTDNIELLIKNNCRAIVQPSGSINDKEIILHANKNNFSLYFVKDRLFKH